MLGKLPVPGRPTIAWPVNVRRKFMECYIIKPAQSLLMKHLVIG